MRGDKEAACFDKIKHALFYKDGMPICNPFDGCSAFTVTDASFAKDHIFYCSSDFNKNYFGLLENERFEFADIIRTAKPNPSSSEFPDFIFDNGCNGVQREHNKKLNNGCLLYTSDAADD